VYNENSLGAAKNRGGNKKVDIIQKE